MEDILDQEVENDNTETNTEASARFLKPNEIVALFAEEKKGNLTKEKKVLLRNLWRYLASEDKRDEEEGRNTSFKRAYEKPDGAAFLNWRTADESIRIQVSPTKRRFTVSKRSLFKAPF